MDGLSIANADTVLKTGQTSSQIRNEGFAGPGDVKSFKDALTDAVNKVNDLSVNADVQMQKLATGETKNIPEVMIASQKAEVAFKLLTQVRNKIIDAYQEIMKMQV